MPTSTHIDNLNINQLTKAQYDAAVQAGTITSTDLSLITDVSAILQVNTLPTASATEEGNIIQYIGTTNQNYTNGCFYKCVSDGQNPATYSWIRIDVQPAGATINDNSTSQTETWSASKLNTMVGDIETLLSQI